jgi:hypothetical protein
MPSGAALFPYANFAQGQVKVIVNYDQIGQRQGQLLHQKAHRLAAEVHEGLGLGQHYFHPRYSASGNTAAGLSLVELQAMLAGEVADTAKAYIMAMLPVVPSWVTQPYY